jgi:drug/metabolite transporter (DMT)-like permease
MDGRIRAYAAFAILCLLFGTSYATVSRALFFCNGSMLSCIRMWVASLCAVVAIVVRMSLNRSYSHQIHGLLDSGSAAVPWRKIFLCGIVNFGLPHSLVTLAQRTVTSVAVTISQPCITLFAFLTSLLLVPDEKCRVAKFAPHVLAIAGAVTTSVPTLQPNVHSQSVDYALLGAAVVSFGVGSVLIKWALPPIDQLVLCLGQSLGSALYTTAFCAWQLGPASMWAAFRNIGWNTIGWGCVLGVVYSFTTSVLYVYVIREMGPVTGGMVNFGQIVVGVLAGVIWMHEWKDYSSRDIALSIAGLATLFIAVFIGFSVQDHDKRRPYSGVKTIL